MSLGSKDVIGRKRYVTAAENAERNTSDQGSWSILGQHASIRKENDNNNVDVMCRHSQITSQLIN